MNIGKKSEESKDDYLLEEVNNHLNYQYKFNIFIAIIISLNSIAVIIQALK